MVDMVVDRREIPGRLAQILNLLMGGDEPAPKTEQLTNGALKEAKVASAPAEVTDEAEAPEEVAEKPAAKKTTKKS